MGFDLSKFTDLAEEAQNDPTSETYGHLDSAFLTIAELILERRIKHKKVVELLQKSGLEKVNEASFSSWWNSVGTKEKREDYQRQLDEKQEKKEAKHFGKDRDVDQIKSDNSKKKATLLGKAATGSTREPDVVRESKPEGPANTEFSCMPNVAPSTSKPATPAHLNQDQSGSKRKDFGRFKAISSKPKSSKPKVEVEVEEAEVDGIEMLVPWSSFLKTANVRHKWNASIVAATLEGMGVVENEGKGVYKLRDNLNGIILGCVVGDRMVFKDISVKPETLLTNMKKFVDNQKL